MATQPCQTPSSAQFIENLKAMRCLLLLLLLLVQSAAQPCKVVQGVLPTDLFAALKEQLLPTANRFRKEHPSGTFWMPVDKQPDNVVEEAISHLMRHVQTTGMLEGQGDLLGAEWWIQHRGGNQALFFHFDADQELSARTPHQWVFPTVSSILYLGAVGGPTLVMDQRMSKVIIPVLRLLTLSPFSLTNLNKKHWYHHAPPRVTWSVCCLVVTAEALLKVYPQPNQYCMFSGDRLHGVLNASVVVSTFLL